VSGASRVWAFAYYTTDGLIRQWQPSYGLLNIPSRADIVDVKISPTPRQYPSNDGTTRAGGALLATGRLFRWGYNDAGAAGIHPDTATVVQHPVEITQLEKQVVSFATTAESTCASLVDGTVKCLGSNAAGELGRGTVDADPHPEAEAIR
jgi:hypothetical protein